MRLFLGIEISEKIKLSLFDQLKTLRDVHEDFAWVDPLNYHITLQFIGEVNNSKEIIEKLKSALYDQKRFSLYAFKIDMNMKTKITFSLIFYRQKLVEEAADKIRQTMNSTKIDDRFEPKLTVAKYRIPSRQQYFVIQKAVSRMEVDLELHVKKLTLFENVLNKGKPTYKKLRDFPLL